MKLIFILSLLVLSAGSALLYYTLPEQVKDRPVLYWATFSDPVKVETVERFYKWREEQGLRPVEIRIDTPNAKFIKKLIQGVSGMGADLIDLYDTDMPIMQRTGILLDVTEEAEKRGFTADRTYASTESYFMQDGRQYGFPRNVGAKLLWFNRDTLRRYGMPDPPTRWDWDTFEAYGKRFVEAANEPGSRNRIFLVDKVLPETLRRGLGLSNFNETMTHCILDDPRNVEVMQRLNHWTVDLRLMPTRQEEDSYAADLGGDFAMLSLFSSGRFAMIGAGRWALIHLMPRGLTDLGVVEPCYSGSPNVRVSIGVIGVYKKTPHKKEAMEFLEFLTSESFNLLIAESGDSLPPLPEYAEHPLFYQPPAFPKEWDVHKPFARAVDEISIPLSISPYILSSTVKRIEEDTLDTMYEGRITPEQASKSMAQKINRAIRLNVLRNPNLAERYEQELALQKKIDACKAEGKPIPPSWIKNPFHLAYYEKQGLLAGATPSP